MAGVAILKVVTVNRDNSAVDRPKPVHLIKAKNDWRDERPQVEMQTQSSDDNSVCQSVRLSIKRVICDKMEERSVQMFISYVRSFSLVFSEEEWLVGATPSTWNFGSTGPRWSEITDFEPIFTRSSSAVTPS